VPWQMTSRRCDVLYLPAENDSRMNSLYDNVGVTLGAADQDLIIQH